jgi:two-component system chemotaxis response regulator CheY
MSASPHLVLGSDTEGAAGWGAVRLVGHDDLELVGTGGRVMRGSPSVDAPRVLIVDDDESFRQLIRMHLERAGFWVVGEAPNGAQGVSDAFRLNPDVMTLDHHMPHLTGERALEHIREIRPKTIVVVVSGTVEEPPAWADTFLPKERVADLPALLIRMLAARDDESKET